MDLVVRIEWSLGNGQAWLGRGDGSELTRIMRHMGILQNDLDVNKVRPHGLPVSLFLQSNLAVV